MMMNFKEATLVVFILSTILLVIFFVSMDYEVEGWKENVIRDVRYYIGEDSTSIIPKTFCKEYATLLIVVNSAPSNHNSRQAIRETWGSQKTAIGRSISLVFFLGNSLNPLIQDQILSESNQYGDIIQGKVLDTYYNLTLKSVHIMKVAADHCIGNVKYLLKIDDDMFLNVSNLMEEIVVRNKSEGVLMGKMFCDAAPIKNPFSKWYCPSYMYNRKIYPNFLSGTSYLMSMDVTAKLYNTATVTPLIHFEDVYLTGICAEIAGIHPEYNPKFTIELDESYCHMKNLITMHHFSPHRMRSTFKTLNNFDVIQKCNSYEDMFNAHNWVRDTLFVPFSRSKRKRSC